MIELFSYTTDPETCPYLKDRLHRLKVRLIHDLTAAEYARELDSGWRRFGRMLFAPTCRSCCECIAIRVLVSEFQASRSQRRVLQRNRDVDVEIGEPTVDEERLELYHRFHAERTRQRGWPRSRTGVAEYVETFLQNAVPTLEFRYRLKGELVAIAYVGDASDAFNSIYAFTAPELARRSLGTFDVLTEIAEAERRGKHYLYLGYYVADCQSMVYKQNFRPNEMLLNGVWQRLV